MSQPTTLHASVVLDRLTFTWPDGSIALDGVSGAFGSGRTGLVGRNGAGKSTLLRPDGRRARTDLGHRHGIAVRSPTSPSS